MAAIDRLAGDIREDRLSAGYVFYGEEEYLAEEFVRGLKKALITSDGQFINLERFDVPEVGWPDIIDNARTASLFFSPWRIVVVRVVEEKKEGKGAGEDKESPTKLSSLEGKIIREYFRSPALRTILILVIAGPVKKSHPLVKFFESLPQGAVIVIKADRLKGDVLYAWMMQRLASSGKSASREALARLEEVAGSDLRRIDHEIEKLTAFTAERKAIDIEDVFLVCDWTKGYVKWDLANAMKKPDLRQSLLILSRAFQEGEAPENVLGGLANFFRDLLLAKLWLGEGRDRKEIFAFLKPQIKEGWGLYTTELRALFSSVERLSPGEINWAIRELEKIDISIKTTGASAQPLIERFVVEYCRRVQRSGARKGAI